MHQIVWRILNGRIHCQICYSEYFREILHFTVYLNNKFQLNCFFKLSWNISKIFSFQKLKISFKQWRAEAWSGGGRGGGVKQFVYRQWQLCHMTLVKRVNTSASIRTTRFRSFHKMQNVLSENLKFEGGGGEDNS